MAARKMAASTVVQRNLPYLRQQFSAALQTCSVVVRVLSLALFLCYFLSYSPVASRAVCVTPGYIIPPAFRIWTLFTHAFFENRIWMVIADIITVGLCGKLIEPLWGAIEMLTFFAIVNTSVAFLSVIYYIILFSMTWDPLYLFSVEIHGLAGYCAGVMVAVKQLMPDHVLLSLPIGKLRNRNVPLTVLLFTIVLWACRILRGTYPVMFTFGVLSSWIYLRFYQYHNNGTRGDMADHFTFASFFPNVLQPPIALVGNITYNFLVKVRLCRKPPRKYNMASSSTSSTVAINLPGIDPQDAERRRQIALRALSERLTKVEQQATWPLLADEELPSSLQTAPNPPLPVTPQKGAPQVAIPIQSLMSPVLAASGDAPSSDKRAILET
ncbi:transmembrane protein 115-like [Ornithodoros turicata]|uniref:transmembrane protein 115-like n=1 Tax=Ornithodoros turicata TaxID=34597 RepID=UPI003138EDFE